MAQATTDGRLEEIGLNDTLAVEYEKTRGGSYSFIGDVLNVREFDDGLVEIDVRDHNPTGLGPWKDYTLTVSQYGVAVYTARPNEEDNQCLGSNATVTIESN